VPPSYALCTAHMYCRYEFLTLQERKDCDREYVVASVRGSRPSMAKSLRSKVKKRFRTVKRGVVKRTLSDPTTKLGKRETQKEQKIREALSGFIQPGKRIKNAFRSNDPDAEIPQYDFQSSQPDYRSGKVEGSGFAAWGANRPKLGRFGGDAPSAHLTLQSDTTVGMDEPADPGVARLLRTTEQIVPMFSSKRAKKRIKNNLTSKSGVDTPAAFRWC